MKRKDFLKILGFGGAAIVSAPSLLLGQSDTLSADVPHETSFEATFTIPPDEINSGDRFRYKDKQGEWRYCFMDSFERIYPLEGGIEEIHPTKAELRTSQSLAHMRKTDMHD